MKYETGTDLRPSGVVLVCQLIAAGLLIGFAVHDGSGQVPPPLLSAMLVVGIAFFVAALHGAIKRLTGWLTPSIALESDSIRLRTSGWKPAQEYPTATIDSIDFVDFEPVLHRTNKPPRRLFLAHAQQLKFRPALRHWAQEHGINIKE